MAEIAVTRKAAIAEHVNPQIADGDAVNLDGESRATQSPKILNFDLEFAFAAAILVLGLAFSTDVCGSRCEWDTPLKGGGGFGVEKEAKRNEEKRNHR